MFLAQDEYKNPAHDEGVLCACGKDLAACGACGRGYAQRGAFPLVDEEEWEEKPASDGPQFGVGELVEKKEETSSEEEFEEKVDFDDTPELSPKRRRYDAEVQCNAWPKVRSKPEARGGVPREVASRTAEDRKRQRDEIAASGDGDQPGLPSAAKPQGPDCGGPRIWHGQKWRNGSGRYANAGGKHREKYEVWHKKKAEGLTGKALAHFHPFQRNGYWEQQARALKIPSPRDEKDEKEARERAEKYGRARLGAWV